MPIPISQNLQLAGQQEVTPWQLPFEELAGGLEQKQKNFDTKAEEVALLETLIPESGVFTIDAKQSLLDDYTPEIQKLEEELYNTGNVSKGRIAALARTIEQDERVAALNEDTKVWTPFYQEKLKTGKIDQGVHNFYDENGMPRQAMTKSDLSFQYLDQVPYMQNTAEFLDKYVKANITQILDDSGIKYQISPLTGKVEVYDEVTKTYSEDRTYERIMDVVVNTVDGRYSMGQNLWNSDDENVFFYKAQFERDYGRPATYEDYKQDVLQPTSRLISSLKVTEDKKRNISSTGGTPTGGSDEEVPLSDIWTPVEVKEGVYSEHDSAIINAVEESTGKTFEETSIVDLQNITDTAYEKYEEHKLSIDDKVKDQTEIFISSLSPEQAELIETIGINVSIENGIIQADIISSFDDLVNEGVLQNTEEDRIAYNDAVANYRGFVNNNSSYNTLNRISLDHENNINILENFKNVVYERFGVDLQEVERLSNEATYEQKYEAVYEDFNKRNPVSPTDFLYLSEFAAPYDRGEKVLESNTSVRNLLQVSEDSFWLAPVGGFTEEQKRDMQKVKSEYEEFKKNKVEEEYKRLTLEERLSDPSDVAEFENMKQAMTDVRTYDNNSYTISNFALTDNATNTSINNLVNNVASFLSKDLLSRSLDASEFRVVSTDMTLEDYQAKYLFDVLKGVKITTEGEGRGVNIKTVVNGKEEIFNWQVRYDIGRDQYMFDIQVPNLPTDDKSNQYNQAQQGVDKISPSLNWVEIPMSDAMVKKIIYDTELDTQIKAEEIKRTQQVMREIDDKGYSSSNLFREDNSYGSEYSKNDINILWTRDKENALVGTVKIGNNNVPTKVTVGSEKEVALLESAFQMLVRNPYYLADPNSLGEILQSIKQDFNTPVSTQKLDDRTFTDLVQTLIAYTPLDLNNETSESYIYNTYNKSVPIVDVVQNYEDRVKVKSEDFRINPNVVDLLNQRMYMALGYLPENSYIDITSGLRSLNEQANLLQDPDNEAAPNSNHLYGNAIDFVVRSMDGTTKDEKAMKEMAKALGGLYHNGHVHLNLQ